MQLLLKTDLRSVVANQSELLHGAEEFFLSGIFPMPSGQSLHLDHFLIKIAKKFCLLVWRSTQEILAEQALAAGVDVIQSLEENWRARCRHTSQ